MIKNYIILFLNIKNSLKRESFFSLTLKTSFLISFYLLLILKRKELINAKNPLNEFKYLNYKTKNIFILNIKEFFNEKGYVNINEIESKIPRGRPWNKVKSNEVNVGSSLDSNYILQTMITASSIIDSQKTETKLRLHFAVVKNFKPKNMLKIYSLRSKIREDVEFNFYDANVVEKDLNELNLKCIIGIWVITFIWEYLIRELENMGYFHKKLLMYI